MAKATINCGTVVLMQVLCDHDVMIISRAANSDINFRYYFLIYIRIIRHELKYSNQKYYNNTIVQIITLRF
jgi:hypothetical protein